jgi:hypothetical protein
MYKKECACGKEFETERFQQKKCQKDCGRTSASKHKAKRIRSSKNDYEFVGVDGEGVDRPDGSHDYVMLSVGDRTLTNGGRHLELTQIFTFLYETFLEKRTAIFVGFFLGYDYIQWLKMLPEERAWLLLTDKGIIKRKSLRQSRLNPTPDPVVWNGWEFDLLAGRRLKLRPHKHHKSDFNGDCRNRTCDWQWDPLNENPAEDPVGHLTEIPEGTIGEEIEDWDEFFGIAPSRLHSVGNTSRESVYPWMYICDTGSFWQQSFLSVINPESWGTEPVCTSEEYDTIVEGKADRGHVYGIGDTSYLDEMSRYNTLENEILGRVTSRLNKGFMNERIPIKIGKADWYGPGRAAQLWMDMLHDTCADEMAVLSNRARLRILGSISGQEIPRENEQGILNADVYMSMPTWFREAAQDSYYGGWFEQFMHGHIGDVWEYDINSAYPHIIASLPCLHTEGMHNGTYQKGTGEPPRTGYVLIYGTIKGSNPYIGAMPYRNKDGLISRPHITRGWYWQHELDASKAAGLVDRVEVEQWVAYVPCDCTPPFNPSDIGISSLYQLRLDFGKNTPQGKSAKLVYNSAYGKTAQSIGNPKYSNPVYASLITAGCRTLILESIASHPGKSACVSMVATDGIYFTSPHPCLTLDSTKLGAWDETKKVGMTQLMPGVYWDDFTRERFKSGKSVKLKSRGVSARDLVKEIGRLDRMFAEQAFVLEAGGEYQWPVIRFQTGFLLDSTKNALARGKWDTAGKVTHGAERSISAAPMTKRDPNPYIEDGYIRTRPIQHRQIETVPYQKSFGWITEEELNDVFQGGVTPDGDPLIHVKGLLNGHG